MAQDGEKMTKARGKETKTGERGLPLWPRGKPVPAFKSYDEEVKWWESYDLEPPPESAWEEVEYVPRATQRPRPHVYRVRFSDDEMATLQALARNRGVSASVIIRDLIRARMPPKPARKNA